ncbi:hypothetical protein BKA70DRAFT_1420913 [Coprinopsis sp. MPI-PUGE-AT-0042]|nr:hypothetical protein BKA70DRAFT_1420913 [Coprinopsis sp. MPI-PUGE-AT-0042]
MVRNTVHRPANDDTPATPKSPKAGDRHAHANTITPHDSKRRKADDDESSVAEGEGEEEDDEEESGDEKSQAAKAASSSPDDHDPDSNDDDEEKEEEEEEEEQLRRSARTKKPPTPSAPSSDVSEDELNVKSSPVKPPKKKPTASIKSVKATATATPTPRRKPTAPKPTVKPSAAATNTTTKKVQPSVKTTSKPAGKTNPTAKASVDNDATGTEHILQALSASIAPPPRRVAPPTSTIPVLKPIPAAPLKAKKKAAVKEVLQEEVEVEVEVPQGDGDVVMQDAIEQEHGWAGTGLGDMEVEEEEAVKIKPKKGKGKEKALAEEVGHGDMEVEEEVVKVNVKPKKVKGKEKVLNEEVEAELKAVSMVELDEEDDGLVFDEEDEFTQHVDSTTLSAAVSNIADSALEKTINDIVPFPRKARVFLESTPAPPSPLNRTAFNFFVTVQGSTVKDAVDAIVDREPSYANHTFYVYDFDEKGWDIMGSSNRLPRTALTVNNFLWEEENSKLYIYVLLKKPSLSAFSSRATTPSVSGYRSRSASGVPSPLSTTFPDAQAPLTEAEAEEADALDAIAQAIEAEKDKRQLRLIYYLEIPTDPYLYNTAATDNWTGYQRFRAANNARDMYAKLKNGAKTNSAGKRLPRDLAKTTAEQITKIFIGKSTFYRSSTFYSQFRKEIPHHRKIMEYFAMDAQARLDVSEEDLFELDPGSKTSGLGLAVAYLKKHGDYEEKEDNEVKEVKEKVVEEKSPEKKKKKQKGGNYLVYFCTIFSAIGLLITSFLSSWFGHLLLATLWLPLVTAQPTSPFPDITFRAFYKFIRQNYDSKISLSSVLLILFTILENPQLLNLHFRRSARQMPGETSSHLWIDRLGRLLDLRFKSNEPLLHPSGGSLATTLHKLALLLELSSPSLHPIDLSAVEPSLALSFQDISSPVTLIKGTRQYGYAYVLGAECPACATSYMADHHWRTTQEKGQEQTLENDACYIKLGQKLWADCTFTRAISNAFHSLHSSSQAFSSFFTDSYVSNSSSSPPPAPLSPTSLVGLPSPPHSLQSVTRRHIWQAHLGESTQMIAADSAIDLTVPYNVSADELVQHAFNLLGNKGKVKPAEGHACGECTQPYRTSTEPDSVVEGCSVNMRVVDGIVTGPLHCARPKCYKPLSNNRGESYCDKHVLEFGHFCRIVGCLALAKSGTRACELHAPEWKHYQASASRSSSSGVKRMIHRPAERQPWQESHERPENPHDRPDPQPHQPKHYFAASRYYCVETLCAPCGVVEAWSLFAKSESPTNIMKFLESVYPNPADRPSYLCIDKACILLKTVANHFRSWISTTRFIVDSYHHRNHSKTDELCQKWCNPAPDDGSAPNLVIKVKDNQGKEVAKCAFNTQICEQLNAWLAGYDSILKRMTVPNFKWFLHSMLFLQTKKVLVKQEHKAAKLARKNVDNGSDAGSPISID